MKKLLPRYSYEFNCILNDSFSETQNIQNFSSLITDKDRFFQLLPLLESALDKIESIIGFSLPESIEFYVVRAEKFKSFSEPITIEYSILPQEMILFLIKEILKTYCTLRFTDEIKREQLINSCIEHIVVQGLLSRKTFEGSIESLHNESKKLYSNYEQLKNDYSSKTLLNYIEETYSNVN